MKRERDDQAMTESLDVANCLMVLSQAPENKPQRSSAAELQVFECKSCNRKFSSFQALGGHRASHNKRPKLGGNELKAQSKPAINLGNKPKIYHCSICGLGFSLGQALGGHMRKHRVSFEEDFRPINQFVAEIPVSKSFHAHLDLNLTPVENDFK